ncbi:MAG: LLM class F420-dependent oxidoreductase [Hyphomicrobiaceae bacterium]
MSRIQLGAGLPLSDIGGDPRTVAAYATTAEALGYDHLCATDHVLGVNAESRPDWGNRNTSADLFHDPFVLLGFLAHATRTIGFSVQVLILPQRQTALVAKQAACVDILSGGRLRLGIGIGWNKAEFVGLNEDWATRGVRSAEQVEVMRHLWANDHVTFTGRWHSIADAGINPRPETGAIPVWFGGHHDNSIKRAARLADGWMMLEHPPGSDAISAFGRLRHLALEAGRRPQDIGIEVWMSAVGEPDQWREEVRFWKRAGVTHITCNNSYARYHHKRISSTSIGSHIDELERFIDAVRDEL